MSFFRKNKVEEVVEKQVPIEDADFYKTSIINSYLTISDLLHKKLVGYSWYASGTEAFSLDEMEYRIWFQKGSKRISFTLKVDHVLHEGSIDNFQYYDLLKEKFREKAKKLVFPEIL